jgi:hypothetical protein
MTSKAEWLALSERCEKATGPDRDIDAEIYDATTPHLLYAGEYAGKRAVRRSGGAVWLPFFTYSIDDITALIERELPAAAWRAVRPLDDRKPQGTIQRRGETGGFNIWVDTEAATPALALCAAFCRAMAEKAE